MNASLDIMVTSDDAVTLRFALPEDASAVADIWRSGWRDGHLGHVPDELAAARTPASFDTRAAEQVGDTVLRHRRQGLRDS
jgi:hypothetical protein